MSAVSMESWAAEGRQIEKDGRASQWRIADWIAAGEQQFKKKSYPAAQAIFGLSRQTLYNLVSTARAFPISRRRETLSFRHHDEVRALPPEKQDELLDRAEREGLTVAALRKAGKLFKPPEEKKSAEPLFRLAFLRQVSVSTLRDSIIKDYLSRPEVVAEMAAADAAWAAAEFGKDETTASSSPETIEAEKRARRDAVLAEVLA